MGYTSDVVQKSIEEMNKLKKENSDNEKLIGDLRNKLEIAAREKEASVEDFARRLQDAIKVFADQKAGDKETIEQLQTDLKTAVSERKALADIIDKDGET